MPAVTVRDLVKEFRRFHRREGLGGAVKDLFHRRSEPLRAVDGISFAIEPGERVGYIGPNGAGKSTTVKMLTGILTPSAGEIRALDLVPHRDRQRYVRRIGVVFGQRTQLWWDLAVIESFRLLQRIYQVEEGDYQRRLGLLREILALDDFLRTPVRKISLGQRMRADLAASLLHGPDLLFLDEPTIGLDLMAKDAIRTFLGDINRELGTTILLTTHDLRDIEALAERVLVIDHGRLVFDGGLDELRAQAGDDATAELDLHAEPDPATLARVGGDQTRWQRLSALRWRASFRRSRLGAAELLRRAVDLLPVADVSLPEPSIEEVIRRIYRTGRVDTPEAAEPGPAPSAGGTAPASGAGEAGQPAAGEAGR
jgi:ABC-2 type transport system ATP-binding protein